MFGSGYGCKNKIGLMKSTYEQNSVFYMFKYEIKVFFINVVILLHVVMPAVHFFLYKNKKVLYNYNSMEELIKHFKHWSEGDKINSNWTYQSVESPKGEFGVSLISDNTNIPYKCKVRSPAYHHMHVLPDIVKGHFLADLSAMIGTVDIVLGEIDR